MFFATTVLRAETHSDVRPLIIGFTPGENAETLKENGEEIGRILGAKVGAPIQIFISKDYAGLVEAMKDKKIDFGFFSALTYVFAEKEAGAKVLLKRVWHGPYYYSTIIVRDDSKIKSLKALKGKRLAFVDKASASGYLYPSVYFKKQNIDPDKYFSQVIFTGNHEASVKLLQEGKVDAIAVFANDEKVAESAWTRFPPKGVAAAQRPKVHPIWTSAPIPNDPFCVRQDFYESNPRISHDLMFSLIELEEDSKDGASFRKLLGDSTLMLATSQQYQPVREMVQELNLTLK